MADKKGEPEDIILGARQLHSRKPVKIQADTDPPDKGDQKYVVGRTLAPSKQPVSLDKSLPKQMFPDRQIATYHTGTDYVPQTGIAMLKKGEVVVPKEKNPMASIYDMVKENKPAKEIDHIRLRKAKGGHIVEHHHKDHSHPMEEHVMANMDDVHDHIEDHMGEMNPGEQEADNGAEAQDQALGE